jgi:hypothetical protein
MQARAGLVAGVDEVLAGSAFMFGNLWLDDVLRRALNPSLPQMQNTDGDPFDREALIEARANFGAIEFRYSRYSGRRDIMDQKAGYAIVDDFRRRAGAERDDWSTAGHGLDHDESERLGPVDGENERRTLAEEPCLLPLVYLADELDIGMGVDQRLNDLVPISLVDAVDLCRDFCSLPPARSGRFSGAMRPKKAR